MSDWELLQQYVQEHSQQAMCELVRRHIDMVHATAVRGLGDAHLADDVAQAVFLVLMRRAATLSPKVSLVGWLFKTTLYAVKDAKRQEARRRHHEQEAGQMKNSPSPDAIAEMPPLLNDAIAGLPAADRTAIVTRYLEGRSTAEMAVALGTNENTARQRLARALERLRKGFARQGLFVAGAALGVALDSFRAPAAPIQITQQITSGILEGTVPLGSSQLIAQGVIRLMITTQLKTIALSAAGILLLLTGAYVAYAAVGAASAPAAARGPTAAAPTAPVAAASAPATSTAAAKYGPAKTPRGTVLAAFRAAEAGDEAGFLSCFSGLTDAQTTSLHQVVAIMHTFGDLLQAVGEKYGEFDKARLAPMLTSGVALSDIDNAPEKIDGANADVNIGTGPGNIPLIQKGDVWLISANVLATFNADNAAQTSKRLEPLRTITADIRAGKYPTAPDLQPVLVKALQDLRNPQ